MGELDVGAIGRITIIIAGAILIASLAVIAAIIINSWRDENEDNTTEIQSGL